MKTMNRFTLLFFLLFAAAFGSCKKENRCDCIKRTGDIVVDIRQIGGFDRIQVENNVNVFVIEDSVFEVRVEAGENIVSLIKTEVKNNTLIVRNKNRCNWTRSYQKPLNVYVHLPKLTYITSDGTGNIRSQNTFHTDTIDVQTMNSGDVELAVDNARVRTHMFGSGDIILKGATDEHDCSIGGTAYIYAGTLRTNYTYIHTFTLGSCYIHATNLLICVIDEKGDVFCTGNPATVERSQNSSGQLHIQ